jgi:hypothetical protein
MRMLRVDRTWLPRLAARIFALIALVQSVFRLLEVSRCSDLASPSVLVLASHLTTTLPRHRRKLYRSLAVGRRANDEAAQLIISQSQFGGFVLGDKSAPLVDVGSLAEASPWPDLAGP